MPKIYKPQKQPDGSFLIPDVEVFELGESKGFNFTKEWFEQAVAVHKDFDAKQYSPSVIIGHNSKITQSNDGTMSIENMEEKPIVAQFSNPRLAADGKTVCVDYAVPDLESIDLLKKHPNRSVRVNPEKHYFSHVAHLGSSEPFFRSLPSMKILDFSADDPEDSFVYADFSQDMDFELDPETPLAEPVATDEPQADSIPHPPSPIPSPEPATFSEEQLPESFRTQYSAMQEELKAFRKEKLEQQKKLIVAQFDTLLATTPIARPILKSFLALRQSLITETPLDLCVEFSDHGQLKSVPFTAALDNLLKQVIQAAESNTLIAKTSEQKLPFSQNPASLHDSVTEQNLPKNFALDQEVKKILKERGIEKFDHIQYAAVRDELVSSGQFTLE